MNGHCAAAEMVENIVRILTAKLFAIFIVIKHEKFRKLHRGYKYTL